MILCRICGKQKPITDSSEWYSRYNHLTGDFEHFCCAHHAIAGGCFAPQPRDIQEKECVTYGAENE